MGSIVDNPYFVLPGQAGGQIGYGGTDASDDLTLSSTIHATKGKILLGSAGNSVYDEANDRLGIGITLPTSPLHVFHATTDLLATFSSGDDLAQIKINDDDTTGYLSVAGGLMSIGAANPFGGNILTINISTGEVAAVDVVTIIKNLAGINPLLHLENRSAAAADVGTSHQWLGAGGRVMGEFQCAWEGAATTDSYISIHTREGDVVSEKIHITSGGNVQLTQELFMQNNKGIWMKGDGGTDVNVMELQDHLYIGDWENWGDLDDVNIYCGAAQNINLQDNNTTFAQFRDAGNTLHIDTTLTGAVKLHPRDTTIGIYSQAADKLDLFAPEVRIGNSSAGAPTTYLGVEPGGDTYWVGEGSGLLFAQIYEEAGTGTVVLAAQDTWYQVLAFTANGESNGAVPDHTEDHITVSKDGIHYGYISISWSQTTAVSIEYDFHVKINNGATDFPCISAHRNSGGASAVGNCSDGGPIDLTANDTVELWVQRLDGGATSRTITIIAATLYVEQIAGT